MKKLSFLLPLFLTIILSSCSCDEDSLDISTGLKAYYPFSGNANDVSGNGNDGTLFGGVTLSTDKQGNVSSAYEFDGIDDYINTFSTFDYSSRSLSLWINPYSITGSGGSDDNTLKHVVISQDDDLLNYGILRIDIDNGKLKLWAAGVDGTYIDDAINKDQWYHLVLIRDNNKTKYYINGVNVFEGTSDNYGSTFNPNDDFVIGAGRSTTNQFFNGKIDNIRIYDIVLAENQIQELFNKYL